MSWDLFIQDLPPGIRHVSEIPDDFKPGPIGRRDDIIARLRAALPPLRESAPNGPFKVTAPGWEVVIDVDEAADVGCVALFVYGGAGAIPIVAAAIEALGGRALDPGSPTGLWDPALARESFEQWQRYRDRVLRKDDTMSSCPPSTASPPTPPG